jgi:hypothetical protein
MSNEEKLVKKRGRKPNTVKKATELYEKKVKAKDLRITTLEQQEFFDSNQVYPLILQLNVNPNTRNVQQHITSQTEFITDTYNSYEQDFFMYKPELNEPLAYDDHRSTNFTSMPELYRVQPTKDSTTVSEMNIKDMFDMSANSNNVTQREPLHHNNDIQQAPQNRQTTNHVSNYILLKDMVMNKDWCEHCPYWCYWDCHPFESSPFGIPTKYKDDKFFVFGCFCSLECAAAYNFYGQENINDMWENYNLLNMLSNKIAYKFCVNPAISRRCLQSFGGPLTIDQFREKNKSNKKYNILTYPMVSLVEHVEEVNETSSYSTKLNCFIPLDKSRICKIEEANKDLLLSKTKTHLEQCMNLRFTT